MNSRKKTSFMRYVDAELAADAGLRSRVNALLNEMRGEQELAARRERYLDLSARTARQLDAKGITGKKLQADFEKFKKRRKVEPRVEDDAPPISAAWRREISRRIKDTDDPTRYVIVSGFSRRMLLYYDASRDCFPANDVGGATLFKRLSVARAVMGVLGDHHVLMKVRLLKDGSIKRLTSLRTILAETWKKTPNRRKEASVVTARTVSGKPRSFLNESALDRATHGARVVLRQGGKAVAAVVPIADLRVLQKLEDDEDLKDIRAARIEMKRKGTISWEKAKGKMGLPSTPATPPAAGTKPSPRSRRRPRR
jgi:antitoxin (DNA-binding transcriptional repressor) of toxin-antitoxin stability system